MILPVKRAWERGSGAGSPDIGHFYKHPASSQRYFLSKIIGVAQGTRHWVYFSTKVYSLITPSPFPRSQTLQSVETLIGTNQPRPYLYIFLLRPTTPLPPPRTQALQNIEPGRASSLALPCLRLWRQGQHLKMLYTQYHVCMISHFPVGIARFMVVKSVLTPVVA